jgi:hypothetical protein
MRPIRSRRHWPSTWCRTRNTFLPVGSTRTTKPGTAAQVTSYILSRGFSPRTVAVVSITHTSIPMIATISSQARRSKSLSENTHSLVYDRAGRFQANPITFVMWYVC